MSNVTLGAIASHPDKHGKHSLVCPKCSQGFLSVISKDEETGVLQSIVCPACKYSDEPKHFIAAAHQTEINDMATGYVAKKLKNVFGGLLK